MMSYPRSIMTKDGLSIVLRPVVPDDARALRSLFAAAVRKKEWFLRRDFTDPLVLDRWLENLNDDGELGTVAVRQDDGEIIGSLLLSFAPNGFRQCLAHLTITVDPKYRFAEVGFWLVWDCIKMAEDWGVETLVADCIPSREKHTVNDLRRLNFFDVQTLRPYVDDDQEANLLIMARTLGGENNGFEHFRSEPAQDFLDEHGKKIGSAGV